MAPGVGNVPGAIFVFHLHVDKSNISIHYVDRSNMDAISLTDSRNLAGSRPD